MCRKIYSIILMFILTIVNVNRQINAETREDSDRIVLTPEQIQQLKDHFAVVDFLKEKQKDIVQQNERISITDPKILFDIMAPVMGGSVLLVAWLLQRKYLGCLQTFIGLLQTQQAPANAQYLFALAKLKARFLNKVILIVSIITLIASVQSWLDFAMIFLSQSQRQYDWNLLQKIIEEPFRL